MRDKKKGEAHEENTGPDVPGGVCTKAIVFNYCSSSHGWTGSVGVWCTATCTPGRERWEGDGTKDRRGGMNASL